MKKKHKIPELLSAISYDDWPPRSIAVREGQSFADAFFETVYKRACQELNLPETPGNNQ